MFRIKYRPNVDTSFVMYDNSSPFIRFFAGGGFEQHLSKLEDVRTNRERLLCMHLGTLIGFRIIKTKYSLSGKKMMKKEHHLKPEMSLNE